MEQQYTASHIIGQEARRPQRHGFDRGRIHLMLPGSPHIPPYSTLKPWDRASHLQSLLLADTLWQGSEDTGRSVLHNLPGSS